MKWKPHPLDWAGVLRRDTDEQLDEWAWAVGSDYVTPEWLRREKERIRDVRKEAVIRGEWAEHKMEYTYIINASRRVPKVTNKKFLDYCERQVNEPRAGFTPPQLHRLFVLAGIENGGNWSKVHHTHIESFTGREREIIERVELARRRMA
jgi:hypothetical protein